MKIVITLILALCISVHAQEKQAPKNEAAKKPIKYFIAELSTNIDNLKHPSCALRLNETTELTLGKTVEVFGKPVFIGQRITITPRKHRKGEKGKKARYNALITYESLGEPDLDHKTGIAKQTNTKYYSQILVSKEIQTVQFAKDITVNISIRRVTATGKEIK